LKRLTISILVLALFSMFTFAQTAPAAPKQGAAAKAPAAAKPAPAAASTQEPVIRVKPPCPAAKAGATAPPCRDSISKKEFETLVKAAGPSVTPPMERSFANNLARMLAYSNEAARLGLQNTPEGKAMLEVSHMQAMAQLLGRKLQTEALNVSDAEMQAYYRENQAKFESATLERILIPHKTGEKDMKGEQDFGDKLRERWVAGEDPEKLQAEAFARVGNTNPPPAAKIGERKRTSLAPEQQVVFGLNPGDISQVFADPSASAIYKLVSKTVVPFDKAREEIKRSIASKRLEETVKELDARTATTLNEAYFNSAQASPAATPADKASPASVAPKAPSAQSEPVSPAPASTPAPGADKQPK
jgi:hypothetical protein